MIGRLFLVLLALLLLVVAAIGYLALRPLDVPEPLQPMASWLERSVPEDLRPAGSLARPFGSNTTSDQPHLAVAGASDSAALPAAVEEVSGRSGVAHVAVDAQGRATVQNDASDPSVAANALTGAQSGGQSGADSPRLASAEPVAGAGNGSTTALQPAAPAGSTTTQGKAGGAEVTARTRMTQSTQDANESSAGPVTTARNRASAIGPAGPAAAATAALAASVARTAAGAAAQASSQATRPAQAADARPSGPRRVALLPPDAPAAPRARTPEGIAQQQSIRNFLAGRVVEFEVGRDRLTRTGIAVLDRLVPLIAANPDTTIIVQGHTDAVGDEASNLELSGARAIAARAYLVSRGIDPSRLKVQGFGELAPIANNETERGRIRNRRIDFAVTDGSPGR